MAAAHHAFAGNLSSSSNDDGPHSPWLLTPRPPPTSGFASQQHQQLPFPTSGGGEGALSSSTGSTLADSPSANSLRTAFDQFSLQDRNSHHRPSLTGSESSTGSASVGAGGGGGGASVRSDSRTSASSNASGSSRVRAAARMFESRLRPGPPSSAESIPNGNSPDASNASRVRSGSGAPVLARASPVFRDNGQEWGAPFGGSSTSLTISTPSSGAPR